MKILEYTNKDFGKAFKRISFAFKTHFTNVEWVDANPDIEIVQVVGDKEYNYLKSKDRLDNVVIHQQCLFSSSIPLETWTELWKQCKLVISFHPIDTYTDEKINFLRSPLGAEPDTFPVSKVQRFYDVFSTGHLPEPECLDKIFEACKATGKKMFHTGEDLNQDPKVYKFLEYMEDPWYCSILQRVKYVTGLRRCEGFEMACIEGAMTGAVPIVPLIPTYDYYKDFGLFIDMEQDITKQLVNILSSEYKPLTKEQIEHVRRTFSWKTICKNIYERLVND